MKRHCIRVEDKISELPESILHHILSFLPTKDATKTSILSKTWNSLWKSFPILSFCEKSFNASVCRNTEPQEVIPEFIKFVNKTIKNRMTDSGLQKFELFVDCERFRLEDDKNNIEGWLSYAINHNVQHLCFCNYFPYMTSKNQQWSHDMPPSIWRAKSLKNLYLFGCQIIESGSIGLSLRRLRLIHVHIDSNTLQTVVSNSCHLLEELTIASCQGFAEVRFPCLFKLKKIELYIPTADAQVITIKAPNVRCISYGGDSGNVLSSIMGSRFETLRELNLHDVEIRDAEFSRVISKFPFLEKIELERCKLLKSIRIPRNINLGIFNCVMLKEINFGV